MASLTFDRPVNFDLENVYDVTTGDFNGDGNLDIVATGYSYNSEIYSYDGKVSILLGDGDGNFAPANSFFINQYSRLSEVVVGDFNGDGNSDLVAKNGYSNGAYVFIGNGAGSFSPVINVDAASRDSIIVDDLNGDGFEDIITTNGYSYSEGQVSVVFANGTGGFESATSFQTGNNSRDVVSGDFNGDGNIDLATSNNDYYDGSDATVSILLGDGAGNFSAPTDFNTSGYNADSIVSADFNGDGTLDLATLDNYNNGNLSILLGDGAGNFGTPTIIEAQNGNSLEAGDLDRDGNIDLVLFSSNYSESISVFLGDGAGGFRFDGDIDTGSSNYDVAIGDLNGDTALDLISANGFRGASLLLGTPGQNLVGTIRRDILQGGNGPDTLEGLGGSDILDGNGGSDQISGGAGKDNITGGAGNDVISGGNGSDIISGGDDNDQINGDAGNDNLDGNDGDDKLNGGLGNDRLRGDRGADSLIGGKGQDSLLGGDGDDTLLGQADNDVLAGGAGNDSLNGARGNDSLLGQAGNDTLQGRTGQDTLEGGSGSDDLDGGSANDSLIGGSGNDFLKGGAGIDTLRGGTGDDTLSGGKGNDILDGGAGIDTVDFSQSKQAITLLSQGVINAGTDGLEQIQNIEVVIGASGKANSIDGTSDGTARLDVNLGANQLIVSNIPVLGSASFTVENFVNVTGTANQDLITGDSADNALFGAQGNDTFGGSVGNDVLDGGEGIDRIDYTDLATAITLNATGIIEKGGLGVDTLNAIEEITGASGLINAIDATLSAGSVSSVDIDLADNAFTVLDSPNSDSLFFEVENFVNVTGSQNNDTLGGNNTANLLIGGLGDDSLNGRGGIDTLIGVDPTSATAGQGELDTLTGGTGADNYLLGDSDTVFYSFSGNDDFALINGFQSGRDQIQLNGVLTDYVFSGVTSNTAIFQDGNRNGLVDAGDELIAQFSGNGFTTSDLKFV